ncbi:RagB/SusD family nutrient uptake outer membrane protein [Echinicola strongylocentroti]|nr:RagB/SusD family nutrient uptake outer membrane protein [Echinicola strongylocentroti]
MRNQNTTYKKIAFYGMMLLGMTSCSEALDPVLDNTYGEDFAYGLPEKTEGFLMNAYANVPGSFVAEYGGDFLDVATDNATTNAFGSALYRVSAGAISPANNPVGNWNNAYNQFRNIHIFLENGLGDNVTYNLSDPDADMAKRMNLKGDAFYLRAWWGFTLLKQYGGKAANGEALGYPIVLSSEEYSETSGLEDIQRNTYEECVEQIVKDLDSAYLYLPKTYTGGDPIVGVQQLGRADKQNVRALKSRVAVYAASPANQSDEVVSIAGMGSFNVLNEAAFVQKWVDAAEYSQEAIEEVGNFSSLKTGDFNNNTSPGEFVWRTYHNNRDLENKNYPISEFGQARTSPSQNLVDAYPMQNGYPIDDPRAGFDPENPYANRDPRLDLTIFYNGQTLDGQALEIYEGGKDSKARNQQNTRTGYYLRKWLSVQNGMLDPVSPTNDHHNHALIRKTEVYLNFAEASNEAFGPTAVGPEMSQSAVEVIKSIRSAAGITDNSYVDEVAAQGKEAFREFIQNERRLELAFENHRYWDLRRWIMPLNETVRGVRILKGEEGDLSFEEFTVEERKFDDVKYYYHPLPYDELVKSPQMIDNKGW